MKLEFFEPCQVPTTTAQQRGRRKYNPAKVQNASALFRAIARKHKPQTPFKGPLIATLCLTWGKVGIDVATLKDTKPDGDNVEKAFWDACEKEGYFFKGDQQLADRRVLKFFGPITGIALSLEEASL